MGRVLAAAVVAVAAAVVPITGAPARAATATATVEVHDNYFDPKELHLSSGDTVRWEVFAAGHTIRSLVEVDGAPLFEFPAGSATTEVGDTFAYTFTDQGEFRFFCEVHGLGMAGVVYVDVVPQTTRRVPEEFGSISSAVAGAPDGTVVDVAPGVYREAVQVDARDVTIRGRGASPSDVVLDGGGALDAGVAAFAGGVIVENLTVTGYRSAGVLVRGADRFTVADVVLTSVGSYGVRALRSRAGAVSRVVVRDVSAAGVSLVDCRTCGAAVDDVDVAGAAVGVQVVNFGSAFVTGSHLSANGTGVLVATDAARGTGPQRGATVRSNELTGNATGVAVTGGFDVDVVGNTVTGGSTAISVRGVPVPSVDVAVHGNTVASSVDLTWDLAGRACFSGNRRPTGPAVTDPPYLQVLFPCGG